MPDFVPVDPELLASLVALYRQCPLKIRAYRGGQTTCVICGALIDKDDWVVTLPGGLPARSRIAQPHCAGDAGFMVE